MKQNLQKLIERGESLDKLEEKTERLNETSVSYGRKAREQNSDCFDICN